MVLTFSGFGLGALNVYVGGWGTGFGARFIRAIKTQKKSKGQNKLPLLFVVCVYLRFIFSFRFSALLQVAALL